jgi:hypothetical protein
MIEGYELLLPINAGELVEFHCFESGDWVLEFLRRINERWETLWPLIEEPFREGVGFTKQVIGGEGFGGFIQFGAGGEEDDDRDLRAYDFLVGFQMADDVPGWEFYITDWKVSAWQSVH